MIKYLTKLFRQKVNNYNFEFNSGKNITSITTKLMKTNMQLTANAEKISSL